MTTQLWISVIVALIAGVSAGLVAPLASAKLNLRNWRAQKSLDLKYEIFRGAVGALASYMTDALDTKLQGAKTTYHGREREVEMRPETSEALEQYRGFMEAFFSKQVAAKFGEATRAPISIETVPNASFEEKRRVFVEAASHELGI